MHLGFFVVYVRCKQKQLSVVTSCTSSLVILPSSLLSALKKQKHTLKFFLVAIKFCARNDNDNDRRIWHSIIRIGLFNTRNMMVGYHDYLTNLCKLYYQLRQCFTAMSQYKNRIILLT